MLHYALVQIRTFFRAVLSFLFPFFSMGGKNLSASDPFAEKSVTESMSRNIKQMRTKTHVAVIKNSTVEHQYAVML